MTTTAPEAAVRPSGGGEAERSGARRRLRGLRHHRRPGEGDDVPLALPTRAARLARLPDRRRRRRRLDRRSARAIARASRSWARARRLDEKMFERFAGRLSYVAGDFGEDATYERVAEAINGAKPPVFYLEIPPFLFGRVVKGLADAGLTRRAASSWRSRSATTVIRRASSPTSSTSTSTSPSLPDRPLPREDGPRGDHLPPLREHDPRADLEPQLHRVSSDHDGGGLRRRGSRSLLRPGRRAARRRREPPDAGRGRGRHGGAGRRRPTSSRTCRSRCSGRSSKPTRPTTSAASTTATSISTASPPTRRPRPTRRFGSRSRTGAGQACRSSSGRASGCPRLRPS